MRPRNEPKPRGHTPAGNKGKSALDKPANYAALSASRLRMTSEAPRRVVIFLNFTTSSSAKKGDARPCVIQFKSRCRISPHSDPGSSATPHPTYFYFKI